MTGIFETTVRAAATWGIMRLAAFNRRRLPPEPNAFLEGIHEPMRAELTLADLEVSGMIPAALEGRYLRMGANPAVPVPAGHHWFLGDGMVHGIALRGGKAVWYRNRWIRSQLNAEARGVAAAPGPRRGGNDTVNTNVVSIGGRVWALVEAGSFPVELSDDLEEQRYNPFDGTLSGSFTGHPHRDPATGEHHAIAYDGSVADAVRHVVVSAEGRVVGERNIAVQDGPSIHDCAFTQRYVIVLDLPVTFSMRTLIAGYAFPFRWNSRHSARVGLLPRDGGALVWCPVEPCYVFHVANAFDDGDGSVVLDVIAYPRVFDEGSQGIDALGRFERWTIDPRSRSVSRRLLDDTPQEFPRVDERRFGQPYRFAYSVAAPPDRDPQLTGATAIFKHDLVAGTRQTHDFGAGRAPGEFVFVPASPEAGEDEGWLVGLVIDRAADTTDLAILNAAHLDAPPVATVHVPHRIPPGFHGNWFPDTRNGGR